MRIKKNLVVISIMAMTIAGCGSIQGGQNSEKLEHEPHSHTTINEVTETPEAMPRVVVATESGVSILDEKLDLVEEFELTSRPSLTLAHDDRHVVANRQDDNESSIIDAGAWRQDHGDHFHFYTDKPALLEDVVKGNKPVHVVPNPSADATTIFADEDGVASLVTTDNLANGEFDSLLQLKANHPHHGVVVPMPENHYLVTATAAEGTALPDTVELRHGESDVEQTFECKRLHGEIARGTKAAFGCADSVLFIDNGKGVNIPTPDLGDERVGTFVANSDFSALVGKAGDRLVFIKDDAAKTVAIEDGVNISNLAITPDGHVVTLGTDGKLYVFNGTGALEYSMQVTEEWEKPSGHRGIAPEVAAGEYANSNTAWISDPHAGTIHMINLSSKNETANATVKGQPTSLVVTNAN